MTQNRYRTHHRSLRSDRSLSLPAPEITQLLSLFVSGVTWLWFFDWSIPASIALVTALIVHELGHGLAMTYFGINYKGPFYIPFLGAGVIPSEPLTRSQAAWMVLAGPVLGIVAGLGLGIVLIFLGAIEIGRRLVEVAIVLNAFNLLPIFPLDGGRLLRLILPAEHRYGASGLVIALLLVIAFGYSQGISQLWLGMAFVWSFVLTALSTLDEPWEETQLGYNAGLRALFDRRHKYYPSRMAHVTLTEHQQACVAFVLGNGLMFLLFWLL